MPVDTPSTADTEREGGDDGEKRSRFTLPSAYTILFALIVITAIATWIIPAGAYQLDADGSPIPGTYHEVESHPQRILIDSLQAPINGTVRHRGSGDRQRRRVQQRRRCSARSTSRSSSS